MIWFRFHSIQQKKKENTNVEEKSIDEFYEKYSFCLRPNTEYFRKLSCLSEQFFFFVFFYTCVKKLVSLEQIKDHLI